MSRRILSILLVIAISLTGQPVAALDTAAAPTAQEETGAQTTALMPDDNALNPPVVSPVIEDDGDTEPTDTSAVIPAEDITAPIAEDLSAAESVAPLAAEAFVQAQAITNEAGLRAAVSSASAGSTVVIGGDVTLTATLFINKNITLDLAGHTLDFTTGSGGIGVRFTTGGTIVDSVGGGKFTGDDANTVLVQCEGGSLTVAGGTLTVSGSQSRAVQNESTLRITGGEVRSASGYAVLNNGTVTVSGGQVITETGVGVINYSAGAALIVSGGTLTSLTLSTEKTYAAFNNVADTTITVSGGTLSAGKGSAVGNYNGGLITVNGGILSADRGHAVFNYGDSTIAVNDGIVSSNAGYGILNYGNLEVKGGDISTNSNAAVANFAKGGTDVHLSGGTITSAAAAAVVHAGSGEIQLLGSTVISNASNSPAVVNASTGLVSVADGTVTANGSATTFYNVSVGRIAVRGGTYSGIYNANPLGSVRIDGGSVKSIGGTTPLNSAGIELKLYCIQLADGGALIANTPVSGTEMTFSPADKADGYGFTGVRTDATGRLFLWLPAGISSALYQSQTVEIGGTVAAGSESVLPNFNVSVTVYLNDQIWTNCPIAYQPVLGIEGTSMLNSVRPSGSNNGVFSYNGLDRDSVYEVWGSSAIGIAYSGVNVSKSSPSVEVHYYTLTVNNGGGISMLLPRTGTNIIQGSKVVFEAFPMSGLTFEKWTNGAGETVSTDSQFTIDSLDGPRTYTATAKVTPFDAAVSVRKNGAAWTAFDGNVVLSDSADNADSPLAGTAASGVYTFSGLTKTYYVWAMLPGGQLAYTGQTVTFGATSAALDYYTVDLSKGASIDQVTGAGTFLKGTRVEAAAEVSPESGGVTYRFSRWSEGGALVSINNPYVISAISRSYDLTAEGRPSGYTATVTVNKDHALWTVGTRAIHLTEQGSDTPITGSFSNGIYTFTGLDIAKTYDIWDDETVQKTGNTLDSSNRDKTLNYFTVTVTQGTGVTSVSGSGVYLGGSTVSAVAVPAAYHSIAWQATGTPGTPNGSAYSVPNLNGVTDLIATGNLVNFNGTVTLRADDAPWSGQTVTLSTDAAQVGTMMPASSTNGSYTFSALDPRNTYYLFVNGKTTGKTLIHTATDATLDYYTITVSPENVTTDASVGAEADSGPYLKGTAVRLTATLTNPNHDFVGWYSGSTLLTTDKVYTLSGIAAKQTLSAKANSTFAAAVTVNGLPDLSVIKLSDTAGSLTHAVTGSVSGNTLTFNDLARGTTYYIFNGSTATGKAVSKTLTTAALQYYTIAVTPSAGISTATANGGTSATVLTGTAVTLSATAEDEFTFSKWMDGGNTVAQTNPATLIAGKDMTLTAMATAVYTGGEIDISAGQITISDSTTSGKLRVVQGATTWDNIDPNQSITINGTSTTNNIVINATLISAPGNAVRLTLKSVDITYNGAAMDINSSAGDVELTLSGTNSLKTTLSGSGAISKRGTQKLTICSIDGTTAHTLEASGNVNTASGIGRQNAYVGNITIDSGVLSVFNRGSGIGSFGAGAMTDGITINGGILQGNGNTSCLIGSADSAYGGLQNVTLNGGTARLALNGGSPSGVKFNGGNLLLGAGSYGTPQNAMGENVYKTTITVPGDTAGGLDVSKTLVITDKNGTVYGMNDVVTFPGGKVYAYLPAGTATAAYNGKTFEVDVATDGLVTVPLIRFNTIASKTVNGVTATATAPVYTGTVYTVTVTLSGTALKPGVITLDLSGAITAVASQTQTVDAGAVSGVTKTFVFAVPADDVADLALVMTFAETAAYGVTYTAPDATTGSLPSDPGRYYAGSAYTVAAAGTLQRTGYTFAGWSPGAGTHAAGSTQTMGGSNVNYAALWTPNTYTVAFNGNGAASGIMAPQIFTYDAAATALSSNGFVRTGYTFVGWATSANGTKVYAPGEAVSNLTAVNNGTVSLYALWKANTYTVTFEGGGATSGATESQIVAHNTATALNANGFARTGYAFAGWETADGTPYANGASITASGNVVLTAQWSDNPYVISFIGNGSTAGAMTDMDLRYGTGGNLPANTFSRTGYTFAGWNTAADGSGAAYANLALVQGLTSGYNDTVPLYAQWTANTYGVQFIINGGTSGAMAQQNLTYDAAETALSSNQYLKSGYVFTGWNLAADGSSVAYTDGAEVSNLTAVSGAVVQLYAQWRPGSFTVNFDSGSGIGTMSAQTFHIGETTPLKACTFTRSGYTFAGWNTAEDGSGAAYGGLAAVNTLVMDAQDSLMLYAQWIPNTYSVKFDGNGGAGVMAAQGFTYDIPPVSLNPNGFLRAGYTFLGWAESPASRAGEYADIQSVRNLTPIPDGVVTLYAVWKANTVSVAFDGNGATDGSMADQSFIYNTEQPLSANTYQRQGYSFAGWNLLSSGRGVSYSDSQPVTDPTPDITGKMTLYAQWQQQSRYGLSGIVTDDGTPAFPVPDATVTLKQGSTVLGVTKTDENGRYSFTNLLPGTYNVVCAYDGKTVTKATTVVDSPQTVSFVIRATGRNSVLELLKETDASMPALVVDGLDAVADDQAQAGQITTVKLTVTAKTASNADGEQNAIKILANNQSVGMFLDAQLTCNGSSIGASNSTVLEILVPYDFSSKTDVKVLRYHGGVAEALTKLNSRPASGFTDGTWYGDISAGRIFIYACKFSTYAVSYSNVVTDSPSSGGGGGGSTGYAVQIDKSGITHGTVTANRSTAAAGAEIIITVRPDSGYLLQRLTITDADGKAILYTDQGDNTYAIKMPDSKITVTATFVPERLPELAKVEFPFVDVSADHWAYGDIAWAHANGIMNGTGDGTTFSPGLSTTRGMIATLLWRMEGRPSVPGSSPFDDVDPATYYEQAITWAAQKKIVEGYGNGRFGPEDTITREQMAAILYRYAGYKRYDVSKSISLDRFADGGKTSGYAKNAMGWAVWNGFVSGKGEGILDPTAGATRAEVAAILKRFSGTFK